MQIHFTRTGPFPSTTKTPTPSSIRRFSAGNRLAFAGAAPEAPGEFTEFQKRRIAIQAGIKAALNRSDLFKSILLAGLVTAFSSLVMHFAALVIFPVWIVSAGIVRGIEAGRYAFQHPQLFKERPHPAQVGPDNGAISSDR